MKHDDSSKAIIVFIVIVLIALAFERCRYEIITDETIPIEQKLYWATF